LHPIQVSPFIIEIPHDGSGLRGSLPVKSKGISFVNPMTIMLGDDMVFIESSSLGTGNKPFPNAGLVSSHFEKMGLRVPSIEVSYN
jgi:hypothetical protein